MKTVEYHTGSGSIEFCCQPYWLTSIEDVNKIANELITAERRILKAVGLHSEFINYYAEIDFSESKIYASFDWLNLDREKAMRILEEAQRRHFKWTIGNPENKKDFANKEE